MMHAQRHRHEDRERRSRRKHGSRSNNGRGNDVDVQSTTFWGLRESKVLIPKWTGEDRSFDLKTRQVAFSLASHDGVITFSVQLTTEDMGELHNVYVRVEKPTKLNVMLEEEEAEGEGEGADQLERGNHRERQRTSRHKRQKVFTHDIAEKYFKQAQDDGASVELSVLCVLKLVRESSDRFSMLEFTLPEDLNPFPYDGKWFWNSRTNTFPSGPEKRLETDRNKAIKAVKQRDEELNDERSFKASIVKEKEKVEAEIRQKEEELEIARSEERNIRAEIEEKRNEVRELKLDRDEATAAAKVARTELRGGTAQSLEDTNGITEVIGAHNDFLKDFDKFLQDYGVEEEDEGAGEGEGEATEYVQDFVRTWLDTAQAFVEQKIDKKREAIYRGLGNIPKKCEGAGYKIERNQLKLLESATHIMGELEDDEREELHKVAEMIPFRQAGKAEDETEEDFNELMLDSERDFFQLSRHVVRLCEWLYIQSLHKGASLKVVLNSQTVGETVEFDPEYCMKPAKGKKSKSLVDGANAVVVFPSLLEMKKHRKDKVEEEEVERFLSRAFVMKP